MLPTQAALHSPVIPGVPLPDGIILPLYDYDFGPGFHYNDLSGIISMAPPVIKQVLPSLVPAVDGDGNETSGVASVLVGGYIPFAKTQAERVAADDPRPSLEERYRTHEGYVAAVRAASARLVRDRFLLQDDADRLIREAESSDVLRSR